MPVPVEDTGLPGERIVTVDSIKYYTLCEGSTSAPMIILIHALMANHHIYDSTVKALHAQGYQTLRFDHIGHNRTLTPAQSDTSLTESAALSFDDICAHVHTIYETVSKALSLKASNPAAIIGCSIGGVIALRYHMLYPSRTLIISMAAPGLSTLEGAPEKWAARIQQWEDEGTNQNLARTTLDRWFPNPPKGMDWDNARRIVQSCSLEGYKICAAATCNFHYTAELGRITDGENVMILAGSDDGNIGPRSVLQEASQQIKGSKYVLLEGVGHIPPMHPEIFEPVLLDFLKQQSPKVLG